MLAMGEEEERGRHI